MPETQSAADLPDAPRLSQIETRWTLLALAHRDQGDASSAARGELMIRYAGAVFQYLLGVTHDHDVAADLAQEFALRFLRGDFRRADPTRGRFRDYVKAAVVNLLTDFHRRRAQQARPITDGPGALIPDPWSDPPDPDRAFLDCWRDGVLSRAWDRLEGQQSHQGQSNYFTVLRFRAENPALHSPEMAERLSAVLGRPVSSGWVRQTLKRARERFAELVRDEVAGSLGPSTPEQFDEELRDLGLWTYCRPARG